MKVGNRCRGLQTAIDNPRNRALNTPFTHKPTLMCWLSPIGRNDP